MSPLFASDAEAYDDFGWSVALSERHALVGARFGGSPGLYEGAAYVYDLARVVAAEPPPASPVSGTLAVWPNPARGVVTVAFDLGAPTSVRLALYDVLGREVALLHEGARGAGRHRVALDTSGLPRGTYLVRLQAESVSLSDLLTLR